MIDHPSPNPDRRPQGQSIDILLLHYTGMKSGRDALERLCDPAAKVSAHYLIEEDGRIFRLIEEGARAWHAGVSFWQGARDINARSIGIELVNPGHEWGPRPYPSAQIAALIALAQAIIRRHNIPAHRILGHSDVAPARKQDPGEWFPWALLAQHGLGLWPDKGFEDFTPPVDAPILQLGDQGAPVLALQAGLASIGYELEENGIFDTQFKAVIEAFQRHFRPSAITGEADPVTAGLILHLADQLADQSSRSRL